MHSVCMMGSAGGAMLAAFLALPHQTEAHGYMRLPVSRQYSECRAFHDDDYENLEPMPYAFSSGGQQGTRLRGQTNTDPLLLAEYGEGLWPLKWAYEKGEMHPNGNYKDPPGIEVRKGVCGDPRQDSAPGTNEDDIVYGTPNRRWPVINKYHEGDVIIIETVSIEVHLGHYEYLLCNTADLDNPDGVVTEDCLNQYPLNRVYDGPEDSPVDPDFPGRYYADAGCLHAERDQTDLFPPGAPRGHINVQKYQLPAGLTCEHCVLRMTWYTGDKCKHPGYEEFNPPSWPGECSKGKEDWVNLDVENCGDSLFAYPQEFANCADIAILPPGSPLGTPSPAETETGPGAAPTAAPEATEPVELSPTLEPVTATLEPLAATPKPAVTSEPESAPTEPLPPPVSAEDEAISQPHPDDDSINDDDMGQCTIEALPYEECGGSTCCPENYECTEMARGCYWQCRPIPNGCSPNWQQCGGIYWRGKACCFPGSECVYHNEEYSVCEPKVGRGALEDDYDDAAADDDDCDDDDDGDDGGDDVMEYDDDGDDGGDDQDGDDDYDDDDDDYDDDDSDNDDHYEVNDYQDDIHDDHDDSHDDHGGYFDVQHDDDHHDRYEEESNNDDHDGQEDDYGDRDDDDYARFDKKKYNDDGRWKSRSSSRSRSHHR